MDKAKDFEKCFEEYKAKKKQEIDEICKEFTDKGVQNGNKTRTAQNSVSNEVV